MWDIGKTHKVRIDGRSEVTLTPNDHVTTGGEGHVYRPKNGTMAIKIWSDPNQAITGRMPEKIKQLAKLTHKWIVAPEAIVKDSAGLPVGYVMPWVDGWPLPLAFTNDWRATNNFNNTDAIKFASKMREVVSFTHGIGAIMGDANELNILGMAGEPRYIDVDAWAIGDFKADKILPPIRDWHAPLFSRDSDWFAWAIVTFQLFTGVHPYRGGHPDFKKTDLEGRMKANVSVFDSKTTLSPAVRDISCIPTDLLDWYREVFQNRLRTVPPDPLATKVAKRAPAAKNALITSGRLQVAAAFRLTGHILRQATHDALLLDDGTLINLSDGRNIGLADPRTAFLRLSDGSIAGAHTSAGKVWFGTLNPGPIAQMHTTESGVAAHHVWVAANRLFAVTNEGLLEMSIQDFGGRKTLLTGRRWALNANATVFGDGAAVWSALGAQYLVVPQDSLAVAIVRARELDGYKILSLVGRGRVVVASMIDKSGTYKRAIVILDANLLSCTVSVSDAESGALTDVITASGIVIHLNAEGKLDMIIPATGNTLTANPGQVGQGRLFATSLGVFCAIDDVVYRFTMA